MKPIFWIVTLYVANKGSKVLRNVCVLSQHYTASQPRRPRLESSPP